MVYIILSVIAILLIVNIILTLKAGKKEAGNRLTEIKTSTGAFASPNDIYNKIVEQELFAFNSKNPVSIVNSELRKSFPGVDLKKSRSQKIFRQVSQGIYSKKYFCPHLS